MIRALLLLNAYNNNSMLYLFPVYNISMTTNNNLIVVYSYWNLVVGCIQYGIASFVQFNIMYIL